MPLVLWRILGVSQASMSCASLALKIHEMIRHGAMLISKGRDIFSVMLPATSQVATTSVVNVVR